ncbi:MAG: chorismate mutase [bacterium]|nr:chorismate mutase [bacterium]
MENQDELQELRTQIDALDRDVINSLAKRTALVEQIGRYKAANSIKAVDEDRRDALKRMWIKSGESLGLPTEFITAIYDTIHEYSVSIENKIKNL